MSKIPYTLQMVDLVSLIRKILPSSNGCKLWQIRKNDHKKSCSLPDMCALNRIFWQMLTLCRFFCVTAAMRFPVRASTYFAQRDKPEQILGLGIFIHIQICAAPEHKKSALVF